MSWQGPLHLSLAASLWGGAYVASKFILDVVPPFTLLFLRYLFAGVLLYLWCRMEGLSLECRRDWKDMARIGFYGYFLSIAAQFAGTMLSSAHLGAVITSLSPVFQSAFAVWLLREPMSRKQKAATGIALLGVLLIVGVPQEGEADNLWANLFLLAAALLWGYYSVVSRGLSGRHPALRITFWGVLIATVCAVPPVAFEWSSWNQAELLRLPILFSVLYLAVFATTVAYFCWNRGLALVDSHKAGLFFLMQPVVGSLLGAMLLGEVLTPAFFGGGALILAAVYLALEQKETAKGEEA